MQRAPPGCGHARRRSSAPPSAIPAFRPGRGDLAARLVAVFGLFFFSGSMVVLLTPVGATSSPKVQAIGLALGLFSGLDVLLRRGAIARAASLVWPALIPIAFVIASMLWSVDPALSARRIFGLLCATSFALWLFERFHDRGLFALLAGAAILIVLANVATAIAVPAIGTHPALTELGDPNPHVGAWRGLYDHKNDFGRMMALCVLILWIAYAVRRSWRRAVGLGLLVGYLGVAGSTSDRPPSCPWRCRFWCASSPRCGRSRRCAAPWSWRCRCPRW